MKCERSEILVVLYPVWIGCKFSYIVNGDLIGSSCPESLAVCPVTHLSETKGSAQLPTYRRPAIDVISPFWF